MNTSYTTTDNPAIGTNAALALLLGGIVQTYGLLLLPQSFLGGLHILSIGVALFVTGLLTTNWAQTTLNITAHRQRRWALTLGVLTVILLATYIAFSL